MAIFHVHFLRNIKKEIPKNKWNNVSLIIKEALENEELVGNAQDKLIENGFVKEAEMFEKYYPSLYNYKVFGNINYKRLRNTNGIERLNEEFKRRSRKIGAFPSDDSLMRLIVSIMMDIDEEWVTGRKYINIEVD